MLWEENLAIEIAHLHKAVQLLRKYENNEWQQVIPDGEFPAPVALHENIGYVRNILSSTVQFTSVKEEYEKIEKLPSDADFFRYQSTLNPTAEMVTSHNVIETYIRRCGKDYRYETAPNPVKGLQCDKKDNVCVGREPGSAESTKFVPNKQTAKCTK